MPLKTFVASLKSTISPFRTPVEGALKTPAKNNLPSPATSATRAFILDEPMSKAVINIKFSFLFFPFLFYHFSFYDYSQKDEEGRGLIIRRMTSDF